MSKCIQPKKETKLTNNSDAAIDILPTFMNKYKCTYIITDISVPAGFLEKYKSYIKRFNSNFPGFLVFDIFVILKFLFYPPFFQYGGNLEFL